MDKWPDGSQPENKITESVIGAAIEVHRHLGPGLLESAYEHCFCYELTQRGHRVVRQLELPVRYKDVLLDCGYRVDLVVDDLVLIELKTVDAIIPIHEAQLLTYLKLSSCLIGLLINFQGPVLKDGIRRLTRRPLNPNESSKSPHTN